MALASGRFDIVEKAEANITKLRGDLASFAASQTRQAEAEAQLRRARGQAE